MAVNTHRPNCANAQNPGCVCTGCGGALHGWHGWTELAEAPQQARDDRRSRLESKIQRNLAGALNLNAPNRQAFIDLARLDVAQFLSADSQSQVVVSSSERVKVSKLADAIMAESWPDIAAEIDAYAENESAARDIKRELANHTWRTLLIALIRWIEQIDEVVQLLSDKAKGFIKRALTENLSGLSKTAADVVVGIVVDKVWTGLARLLEAHFPLLGEDTLRCLRILALFTCPSAEAHPEVYQHAAKPLMGDAGEIISAEVRSQVAILFTAWWRKRSPETNA